MLKELLGNGVHTLLYILYVYCITQEFEVEGFGQGKFWMTRVQEEEGEDILNETWVGSLPTRGRQMYQKCCFSRLGNFARIQLL